MTENKNVELVEVPELTQRDKVETYIRSTFLLGSFNSNACSPSGSRSP